MRYMLSNYKEVHAAGIDAIHKKIADNFVMKWEAGRELAAMIFYAAKMRLEAQYVMYAEVTPVFNYRGFPSPYYRLDMQLTWVNKQIDLSKIFTFGEIFGEDNQYVTFNL